MNLLTNRHILPKLYSLAVRSLRPMHAASRPVRYHCTNTANTILFPISSFQSLPPLSRPVILCCALPFPLLQYLQCRNVEGSPTSYSNLLLYLFVASPAPLYLTPDLALESSQIAFLLQGDFHIWHPQNVRIFFTPSSPCHIQKSADFVPFVCFLGTLSPHPLQTSYMEAPPSQIAFLLQQRDCKPALDSVGFRRNGGSVQSPSDAWGRWGPFLCVLTPTSKGGSTGWSSWILHRKWKYSIGFLTDNIVKIEKALLNRIQNTVLSGCSDMQSW